jgi:hypothetical protein
VLEEPLEPLEPLGVDDVVLAAVDVSLFAGSVLVLLSLVLGVDASAELSLFFAPAPLLLYKSAYQPPPLRMKPAPPEIWRLAVAWWHCGHSVRGAALIDCSASQPWPQAMQAYS